MQIALQQEASAALPACTVPPVEPALTEELLESYSNQQDEAFPLQPELHSFIPSNSSPTNQTSSIPTNQDSAL